MVAYPLLVFLASLIFYGGAGVNLVSYCCDHCEDEGVEVLLEDNCCDIHQHDLPAFVVYASNDTHAHGCDIERVSFDWNSVNVSLPDLHPVVYDLFFSSIPNTLHIPVLWINKYVSCMITGPPVLCPRTYLSFLTLLLI